AGIVQGGLFLREKPLGFPVFVESRIETAVAYTEGDSPLFLGAFGVVLALRLEPRWGFAAGQSESQENGRIPSLPAGATSHRVLKNEQVFQVGRTKARGLKVFQSATRARDGQA